MKRLTHQTTGLTDMEAGQFVEENRSSIACSCPIVIHCHGWWLGLAASRGKGEPHFAEEKKTAEAIDSEGWMHSGDKGGAGAHVFAGAGDFLWRLLS